MRISFLINTAGQVPRAGGENTLAKGFYIGVTVRSCVENVKIGVNKYAHESHRRLKSAVLNPVFLSVYSYKLNTRDK